MRGALLLVGVALCACTASTQARMGKTSTNDPGVQFSLLKFDDASEYHFAQDRGHVVLMDIWATWCEPCRDLLPLYNQMGAQYTSQGLRVYGLTVDEDPAYVKRFLHENKVSFPILVDTQGVVTEEWLKVQLIPTTLLFDRKGQLRFRHDGIEPGMKLKIREEIQLLINEKENSQ